jgi:hypothetical protein
VLVEVSLIVLCVVFASALREIGLRPLHFYS